MLISLAVLSKPGARPRNEDACGYWGEAGPICCVLSDGAGGHRGGEVAAHTAVAAVLDGFVHSPGLSTALVARLMANANDAVLKRQQEDPELVSMRATLVVLICDPAGATACWGHIGDSRLYHMRGGKLLTRTKDHSLFQSMVDAGLMSATGGDGAAASRSVLVGALGAEDQSAATVAPPVELAAGDALLLCSDGLWDHFSDTELIELRMQSESAERWLARMDERVRAVNRSAQDNYSAIAVWCDADGPGSGSISR